METHKGFAALSIVLIICAVFAVGGGVYYYSENKDVQEMEVETETDVDVSTTEITDRVTTAISKERRDTVPSTGNINTDSSVNTTKKWQTYTDPQRRFSIQYPANWFITHNTQDTFQVADRSEVHFDGRASTVDVFLNVDSGSSYDWKYNAVSFTGGSFYIKRIYFQEVKISILARASTENDKKLEDQILSTFKLAS